MKELKDELVGLKVALLLKKLGFSTKVREGWLYSTPEPENEPKAYPGQSKENWNRWFDDKRLSWASRPTQAMAQRYLREAHGVIVNVLSHPTTGKKLKFFYNVEKYDNKTFHFTGELLNSVSKYKEKFFGTYEEALEYALWHSLIQLTE